MFTARHRKHLSVSKRDAQGHFPLAHARENNFALAVTFRTGRNPLRVNDFYQGACVGGFIFLAQPVCVAVVIGEYSNAGGWHYANGVKRGFTILADINGKRLAVCVTVLKDRRAARQGKHQSLRQVSAQAVFPGLKIFEGKWRVLGCGQRPCNPKLQMGQRQQDTSLASLIAVQCAIHAAIQPYAALERSGLDPADGQADAAFQGKRVGDACPVFAGRNDIIEIVYLLTNRSDNIGFRHDRCNAVDCLGQIPEYQFAVLVGLPLCDNKLLAA